MCHIRHMSNIILKVKRLYHHAAALVPTKLPRGLKEFDDWANSVIDLYGAPNNDSVKFTLAVMILHLGETTSHKPKLYFGRALGKTMSNQVVSQIIQDLKSKQEAARKAEALDVKPE